MSNVYPMKCRIRAEAGVTRVEVYDDIGEGGWFSEGLTAKDFAGQMAGVKGPLDVHINSYGGDVSDGLAIASSIRSHNGPKKTIVDGFAASIASVIAQAGDERVMQQGSMMMIHDALTSMAGNAAAMRAAADFLDKHSDNLAAIYASRAGGTAQQWRDTMQTDTWYTAEEAVAAGLADKVGTGQAVLPAGTDIAAFTTVPGRIAAQLQALPKAAAAGSEGDDDSGAQCQTCGGTGRLKHPSTGKPGVKCPACGGSGTAPAGDDENQDEPGAEDAAGDCGTCDGTGKIMEGHRECPDCGGTGKAGAQDSLPAALAGAATALSALQEALQAASGQPGTHGDHEKFDPDGDGDCDACPEGDTDHDYWSADGKQLKSVPGKPMPSQGALDERFAAAVRQLLIDAGLLPDADGFIRSAADVDNSDWDASKAWHNGAEADDPAAFYKGICAGRKAGDPATQAAWALPYKYTPSSPPNAAGVKNALSRLPQTEGLTNAAEAKATLQAAMKKVNPDYEPDDSTDDRPAAGGDDTDLSGIDLDEIRTALKEAVR